ERMRPLPVFSSAVSATSRLNAPLTEPSASPIALVAPAAGRFTDVPVPLFGFAPRGSVGALFVPSAPPTEIVFGNASGVVLPSSGIIRPLKPHWMPSARANDRVV